MVNRSVKAIGVDSKASPYGWNQLWLERSYSPSSNVGPANNDGADAFRLLELESRDA